MKEIQNLVNHLLETVESIDQGNITREDLRNRLLIVSEGLENLLPKEKEILNDKLIGIYFKTSYILPEMEITKREYAYIKNNTFICKVTEKTKNNGYDSDMENVKHLVGMEFTLLDMSVSQSSSTLRLKEFPNKSFNTVNFEITLKQ